MSINYTGPKQFSWTQHFHQEQVFGPCEVCLDLQEDLPVLRVWDGQNTEVVHLLLAPDAAIKLAAQALAAKAGSDWRAYGKQLVAESRGRFSALNEVRLDPAAGLQAGAAPGRGAGILIDPTAVVSLDSQAMEDWRQKRADQKSADQKSADLLLELMQAARKVTTALNPHEGIERVPALREALDALDAFALAHAESDTP